MNLWMGDGLLKSWVSSIDRVIMMSHQKGERVYVSIDWSEKNLSTRERTSISAVGRIRDSSKTVLYVFSFCSMASTCRHTFEILLRHRQKKHDTINAGTPIAQSGAQNSMTCNPPFLRDVRRTELVLVPRRTLNSRHCFIVCTCFLIN